MGNNSKLIGTHTHIVCMQRDAYFSIATGFNGNIPKYQMAERTVSRKSELNKWLWSLRDMLNREKLLKQRFGQSIHGVTYLIIVIYDNFC